MRIQVNALLFLFLLLQLQWLPLMGGNVIIWNHKFDKGFKPWKFQHWIPKKTIPGSIVEDPDGSGGKIFCFFRKNSRNEFIYFSSRLNEKQNYTLRFRVRCDNVPNDDFFLRIQVFGEEDSNINSRFLVLPNTPNTVLWKTGKTHEWKEFEVKIPAGTVKGSPNANFYFYRKKNSCGKVWLDKVSLSSDGPVKKGLQATVVEPVSPNALAATASNLFKFDASFETVSDLFPFKTDSHEAVNGQRSLKIPAGESKFQSRNLFRLLAPRTSYSMTVCLKANRPCEVMFRAYNDIWRSSCYAKLKVGTQWGLFKIPVKALPNMTTGFFFLITKPKDIVLWMDNLQLNTGKYSGYSPHDPFGASFDRLEIKGNTLIQSNSPVNGVLNVRNDNTKGECFHVKAELLPLGEHPITIFKRDIELKAGETCSIPVNIMKEAKRGYYILRSSIQDKSVEQPLLIVDPPLPVAVNSFFGIHGNEYSRIIGASGIRRFHFWKDAKRDKKGKYIFDKNKFESERKTGMFRFDTIVIYRPPNDLKVGKHASQEEIARYLKSFTAFLASYSNFIEIENEPDYGYPGILKTGWAEAADYYAVIVAKNAEKIKKNHPKIMLAACGSSADTRWNYKFMRRFNSNRKAASEVDCYAIHPYTRQRFISSAGTDIGPETADLYERIRAGRRTIDEVSKKRHMWIGEIGYALAVEEPYNGECAMRHAAFLVRTMLIAKSLEAEKCFYFMQEGCIEQERFFYGLWRNSYPLPAAGAYAGTAQMLEGAQNVEILREKIVHCHIFKHRNGRPFAAWWTENGEDITLRLQHKNFEFRNMFNNQLSSTDQLSISGNPIYIIAKDCNLEKFRREMLQAKVDSPAVALDWQLLRANCLKLKVSNTLNKKINGQIKVSGLRSGEQVFPFFLAPKANTILILKDDKKVVNIPLNIEITANKNKWKCHYLAETLSCSSGGRIKEIGKYGRLPDFKNRNYLLPADPNNGWDGPEDLSVKSSISYNKKFFYLAVDVQDDIHRALINQWNLWNFDSLQLAFDPQADASRRFGYNDDDCEFVFALVKGRPIFRIVRMNNKDHRKEALKSIVCKITRKNGITAYRIAIPWKIIGIKPESGKTVFGMNFVINDDDGFDRQYWMGLTPGLATLRKNPYPFKKVILK